MKSIYSRAASHTTRLFSLAATHALATIRITTAAVVRSVAAIANLHLIFHNANLLCYCNIAMNKDKKS